MGNRNELLFLEKHRPDIKGSVIEIGSRNYGNAQDYRKLFPDSPYLGTDMSAGNGVDRILDIEAEALEQSYALLICCSVLEHVKRPWVAAENITATLEPEGWLYLTIPWVWRYHPYPDDYFRFSPSAIKSLFPEFQWVAQGYSTNKAGEFFETCPDDKNSFTQDGTKYLPYVQVHMLGRRHGPAE